MINRTVLKRIQGQAHTDGDGVKIRKLIGGSEIRSFDPFLMLDEFKSDTPGDYIGGFPNHPHRGFETVTYLLHGRMRHEDSKGNKGILTPGALQFMRAGKGIIHSEMPEQENGLMWGYQLWVNLPSYQKMSEPHYQDVFPNDVPEVPIEGGKVKVLSGSYLDHKSPAENFYPFQYLDVQLEPGKKWNLNTSIHWNYILYPIEGDLQIKEEETILKERTLALLSKGDQLELKNVSNTNSKFLVFGGQPIGEPMIQYGPFVMNFENEIHEAINDFNSGKLGR
jgi:redox-sensitive bicupin YhaK (pirin superfamily)